MESREGSHLRSRYFPTVAHLVGIHTLCDFPGVSALARQARLMTAYVIEKEPGNGALVMIASEEQADDEMQDNWKFTTTWSSLFIGTAFQH